MSETEHVSLPELVKEISIPEGKYLEYSPADDLKPYINKYYQMIGFGSFDGKDIWPIGKESTELHFHFNDEGFNVFTAKDGGFVSRKAYMVGNQHYYELHNTMILNSINMLTVDLTARGLMAITGHYPASFRNRIVELEDICPINFTELFDRLQNKKENPSRLMHLNNYLKNCIEESKHTTKPDNDFFNFLQQLNGKSIKESCKLISINRRTLERQFRKKIGLSPKEYVTTKRFNKACELLSHYPNISLSELSSEADFYDQSHFSREFLKVTSESPVKYIKGINGLFYFGRAYII